MCEPNLENKSQSLLLFYLEFLKDSWKITVSSAKFRPEISKITRYHRLRSMRILKVVYHVDNFRVLFYNPLTLFDPQQQSDLYLWPRSQPCGQKNRLLYFTLFANKDTRIHLSHPDNQPYDCKSYSYVNIHHFLGIEIHAVQHNLDNCLHPTYRYNHWHHH